MNAILLNIRHGGGLRAQALLDWLILSLPDVIVLPEWRDNASGEHIKRGLESIGFFTATLSRAKANGLLVAAKTAFQTRQIMPAGSEKGAILLGDLASGCKLLAAYFPQGKAKIPFFDACMDEAGCCADAPLVLLGDLNTGRNDIDVEGNGTPFTCADQFEALQSKAGLVDLWRLEHGQQRAWTWRSQINGFRVDHAFANMAFRQQYHSIRCLYDHEPREVGLTDHSALILQCTQ